MHTLNILQIKPYQNPTQLGETNTLNCVFLAWSLFAVQLLNKDAADAKFCLSESCPAGILSDSQQM